MDITLFVQLVDELQTLLDRHFFRAFSPRGLPVAGVDEIPGAEAVGPEDKTEATAFVESPGDAATDAWHPNKAVDKGKDLLYFLNCHCLSVMVDGQPPGDERANDGAQWGWCQP
jgi:hypothetical protein